MFNAEQFCKDYNIRIPDLSQNTQEGWINIQCPFCDDSSNHGGFNVAGEYYYCWKCGWHSLADVIYELTGLYKFEIIDNYNKPFFVKARKKSSAKTIELPPETTDLKKSHKKYLLIRNFNPEKIRKTWDIRGTHCAGSYAYRIIAPIYYKGKLVSYQARDITGKASIKYKACTIEKEVIHHKHLVYGIDYVRQRKGIIVEGIFDVWRLGPGAICTFGTSYTPEQIRFIKEHLDIIFILYDFNEIQAQKKAEKLCIDLSSFNKIVEIIGIDHKGDPASMKQKDANHLKRELLGVNYL